MDKIIKNEMRFTKDDAIELGEPDIVVTGGGDNVLNGIIL